MKLYILCLQITIGLLALENVSSSRDPSDFIVKAIGCRWFPRIKRCENYGMTLHRTPYCGFGRYEIYCRKRIDLSRLQINDDPKSLHIVSYNVKELPYIFRRTGQRERTCRIPEALLAKVPKADVIVFQELFMGGCVKARMSITRLLKSFKFKWFYSPTNDKKDIIRVGSGLMIASRWPIVASDYVTYKYVKKLSSDNLARKGALYAAIQKHGQTFHIFNTHLQSGKSYYQVRKLQALELMNFKSALNIPKNEMVLYVGDFNEDKYRQSGNVNHIFSSILKSHIAKRTGGLKYTFEGRNVFNPWNIRSEWLDYLVYSKDHKQPKNATMRAIDLRASKSFEYCSVSPVLLHYQPPSSFKCFSRKWTNTLSDHNLIYGVIRV